MDYDINKLHEVQLDLLKKFIKICCKLNLKYFLVGGSALGAVKYKGFVPWDDDLDVALPRGDYEKFLLEAEKYFEYPYFLQNYRTDPEFPFLFSKIRYSETAFVEESWKNLKINHGIYIDVFPLDGYPEGKAGQLALNAKIAWYKTLLSFSRNKYRASLTARGRLEQLCYNTFGKHMSTAKIMKRYENTVKKYDPDKSGYLYNYGNKMHAVEKVPAEVYGNGTRAEFEELTVMIPKRYDDFLRQRFGDYTAELPEDKRVGSHIFSAVDTEKSYKLYIP